MAMFKRIIWNDLKKSPTISAIMLLFITAAALLISLAVTLGLQLAGSIEFLNIDGGKIAIGDSTLADSVQDSTSDCYPRCQSGCKCQTHPVYA
jgi:hypothetical protein